MNKDNILVCLGTIAETTVGRDLFDPIHIRFTVTLDHEADEKYIKEAWERTKRIYPVIDAVLGFEHDISVYINKETRGKYMGDHVYLVKAEEGVNDPIKSRTPVNPGTDACGRRLISISFYKDSISISAYHTIVDGDGVNKIFNTFLYLYMALYTRHEDENPVVELREGRDIGEYYTANMSELLYAHEYKPMPVYTFPMGCRGFIDEDMVNDEHVYAASLKLDASDFMKYCKENGINPSALVCAASAKTAYAVNPERRDDVVLSLTVSLKKMLERKDDISNAVALAHSYVTCDEIMNKPIEEVAKRIRGDVDSQRSLDYYSSLFRLFTTYRNAPLFQARLVTYIGTVDIGDNNIHILEHKVETNSNMVVYLMQVGDRFYLTLLYGKATEKYLKEFDAFFQGLGIKSEIYAPTHYVVKGTDTAVL